MENKKQRKNTLRKSAIATMLLTALATNANAQNWANGYLGYLTDKQETAVKIEGGGTINNLPVYSFVDLNQDSWFAKARIGKPITETIQAIAEYEGGTSCEDVVRFGVSYNPETIENNHTSIKLLPITTQDDKSLLSIFSTQEFTPKLAGSILVNYNIEDNTFYVEPELNYQIAKGTKVFVQPRTFGKLENLFNNPEIYTGVKFNF